jgi:hypothetical protein
VFEMMSNNSLFVEDNFANFFVRLFTMFSDFLVAFLEITMIFADGFC